MPDKPTPASKPTLDEWNVFTAIETFWHSKKFFPGTEEILKLTGIPQDRISIILESDRAKKRFEALGIDVNAVPLADRGELRRNQTGLTDKQLAVAETILNPLDKRSHNRKLESLGVKPVTYNGWRSNKTFSDYMAQRAEDMFGDAMPLAKEALVRKLMAGDTAAMRLYFEMTGKYNRQQVTTTQDFKMLVIRMVEIIQKHIKDPALLQILSDDIRGLIEPSSSRTMTQGEIVYGSDSEIGA